MSEPTEDSATENRVNTRAFARQMAAQLSPTGAIPKTTPAGSKQKTDPCTPPKDEKQHEEEKDNSKTTAQGNDDLRLAVLKILGMPATSKDLIANLQSLLESHGAATEGEGPIHADIRPVRETPPHPDQAEAIFAPFLQQPSLKEQPPKMAEQQPIRNPDSNSPARTKPNPKTVNGSPENNKGKQNQGTKGLPTELEIEKAIETLTAAFGSNFKPPAFSPSMQKACKGQENAQASTKAPEHSSTLPPTSLPPQAPRPRSQAAYLPAPRPPPGFPIRSVTDAFDAGPNVMLTAQPTFWEPHPAITSFSGLPQMASNESNLPLAGLGLNLEAAAASSSPDGLQQKMSSAHAQYLPLKSEEKKNRSLSV